MQTLTTLTRFGMSYVFDFVEKNPEENLGKLMDWADRFAGGANRAMAKQRKVLREVAEDPSHPMYQLAMRVMTNTDRGVLKAFMENFFVNAAMVGWPKQEALREKYDCNIPWTILMDPTTACNLRCTGCWAEEYGQHCHLSFDTMDDIINQGKDLGIYFYIFTGGEPMMRRDDLIALCRKHYDAIFLMFTNGTMIDDAFAEKMLEVKNLVPAISIEGSREATDRRRGHGTYDQVVEAMDVLRRHRLPFGVSCCYTRDNAESISSEAFIDQLIEWGAAFAWYFHYMPVGKDAVTALLPTPDQRQAIYHRLREVRRTKPLFVMDFQNDGEYVDGCIAGGNRYFHINANGDCEPCVFIHYANTNIHESSLIEALRSPLFKAYHDRQPFHSNHLQPCPMLENPAILQAMVAESGAQSTDLQAPEAVTDLCGKCEPYARAWAPVADALWTKSEEVGSSV